MRLFVFGFLFLTTTSCVTNRFFKKDHTNPPPQVSQQPLPKFATLDTNKDGVVTEEEHKEAQEKRREPFVTPYLVFGGMLLAIILICGLSGIRYGPFFTNCRASLSNSRKKLVDLLSKLKKKKEK